MEITDTDLDFLLSDWFERNEETFVKVRETGRIGWEKTLGKGEAYSSYLIEAPTPKDLLTRAYPLAKDIIIVMETPKKVNIKLSTKDSSFVRGDTLSVSVKVFDEPGLSNGEKLDVFLGLTVHEGCHLLWTDDTIYRGLDKEGKRNPQILHNIWNILEDERIETICGDKKPGLARFLEKTKYYYFDTQFLDTPPTEMNPFETIFTTFLRIVRYPKYLNREDFKLFGDYLIRIKDVLHPFPDAKGTVQAAEIIYDILREFYEELKEEEKSEEGEEGDGEGDESKIKGFGKGDGESKEGKLSAEEIDEMFGEEAKDMMKSLESGELVSFKSDEHSDKLGLTDSLTSLDCSIIEGSVEAGSEKEVFFEKAEDDVTTYKRSYDRIRRYIPSIRKIVQGHCKEYKLIHKSMRSGVFDTTKLAEAFQGVPSVYIREGEVKTDKIAVVVLVDESGSMSGIRMTSARDAAVLLNEAFKGIPNVELFIYGHSGDTLTPRSTDLRIYRERNYTPPYSLGSMDARRENRDGTAILNVAKRVRRQTKEHCLYFILSDGAPSASSYSGSSAVRDVKEKVRQTENLGFSVIQICINKSGYKPADMFKHFMVLENLNTLATDLAKLIKKATLKNTKERVT